MITCCNYGTYQGREIQKYTLQDKISVEVLTLGATVISLSAPNNCGTVTDVLLGFTSVEDIANSTTYMGAVVGRCANRIAGGKFSLQGKTYQLATNDNGVNHLHGGNCGFDRKVFDARIDGNTLCLSAKSADGEENYPAEVEFSVCYTVTGSKLAIDYFAKSNGTTLFNPTNHAYFNLDGQDSGSIDGNFLQIFAQNFLPIDKNLIPTGEVKSVVGTPFDFTVPKPIGRDIEAPCAQLALAGGYDHNFCLQGSHAVFAYSDKTGITLDCFTDRCGLQFYSGNFLSGEKGKALYSKRAGFCLETQFYPNAINLPNWQQPILQAGEMFHSQTSYLFGLLK